MQLDWSTWLNNENKNSLFAYKLDHKSFFKWLIMVTDQKFFAAGIYHCFVGCYVGASSYKNWYLPHAGVLIIMKAFSDIFHVWLNQKKGPWTPLFSNLSLSKWYELLFPQFWKSFGLKTLFFLISSPQAGKNNLIQNIYHSATKNFFWKYM